MPSVTTIGTAAQDLPSPTFSPRQIDVMERILRGDVPEDQIDALLDSVGLDNNQLTDYMAEHPQAPPPPPPPPAPRGMPRGRGQSPPRGRGRGRGGDAAGWHPEGVAGTTTMEARPAVAAAVEGDVVAVAVAADAAPPLDERA